MCFVYVTGLNWKKKWCAIFVTEIKSIFCFCCIGSCIEWRRSSIQRERARKPQFLFNQSLTHPIKSFKLYTITYYTHLTCLHNVFSCTSVPMLYLNSLHSNPCQGTQPLKYIKSAVLGQAPGIDLSIYHALLNPQKKMSLAFKLTESFSLAGKRCSGHEEVFFFIYYLAWKNK